MIKRGERTASMTLRIFENSQTFETSFPPGWQPGDDLSELGSELLVTFAQMLIEEGLIVSMGKGLPYGVPE